MELLQDKGTFNVLAKWPSSYTNANAQLLIEKAGRTCYQSEKQPITDKSAQIFCEKVLKLTHLSVIGHGWRGYIIHPSLLCDQLFEYVLKAFWPVSKFLFVTEREDGSILVSANLETWRKLLHMRLAEFSADIVQDLRMFAPTILNCSYPELFPGPFTATPIQSLKQLLTVNEQLTHIAHTVQYVDVSRACVNELERHQGPIYSQESTRYVDESNVRVVLPSHRRKFEILDEIVSNIERVYKDLRGLGWAKEDARQILPNGMVAETVMSCNLQERRYIYFRRMDYNAHWEIRRLTMAEFLLFREEYPKLFDMFEYQDKPAKDGIVGYYTVKDPSLFYNMRRDTE